MSTHRLRDPSPSETEWVTGVTVDSILGLRERDCDPGKEDQEKISSVVTPRSSTSGRTSSGSLDRDPSGVEVPRH